MGEPGGDAGCRSARGCCSAVPPQTPKYLRQSTFWSRQNFRGNQRGDCVCVKVTRLDSCGAQGTIFLATSVAFLSPWLQTNKRPAFELDRAWGLRG